MYEYKNSKITAASAAKRALDATARVPGPDENTGCRKNITEPELIFAILAYYRDLSTSAMVLNKCYSE
jgi:hypothetical protein